MYVNIETFCYLFLLVNMACVKYMERQNDFVRGGGVGGYKELLESARGELLPFYNIPGKFQEN